MIQNDESKDVVAKVLEGFKFLLENINTSFLQPNGPKELLS